VPLAWTLLRDYQKQRILTLSIPESDPLGAGYHTIQAKIAIAPADYGKGWLNGTQSSSSSCRRSTPISSSRARRGVRAVGVLWLLTLYILIVLRGLYMATQAQAPTAPARRLGHAWSSSCTRS